MKLRNAGVSQTIFPHSYLGCLERLISNDKKTFPKPQKQALKNVKVTKKSSKQMSTFSCEKCHQRPLAEFCLFSKFSGTFDDLHCPPLVWARSDGRWWKNEKFGLTKKYFVKSTL